MKKYKEIQKVVSEYYAGCLQEFGPTPKGVDWNGQSSQELRFLQLLKIVTNADVPYSLNDLGCGYGALYEYINTLGSKVSYVGVDISSEMIEQARKRFGAPDFFLVGDKFQRVADYSVASGLMNVKLETSDAIWTDFCLSVLDELDRSCSGGFSFNCLTSFSDQEKRRAHLYYGDPLFFFKYCKEKFSRNVALLHDYDLYEFTILVRK